MTSAMAKTGFVEVDEGRLFWKYDSPVHYKDSAQIGPRPRPVLLFIHVSALSELTIPLSYLFEPEDKPGEWNEQVTYFTARGWCTLRFDLLGYGQSLPSESYIQRGRTPAVKHHDHAMEVIEEYRLFRGRAAIDEKFVVIGLSRGANHAVDFALQFPYLVTGLILCAGGLGGFDFANTTQEIAMFQRYDEFISKGDAHNAAMMNVRIWGQGTQGNDGRLSRVVGDQLFEWCRMIAQREIDGNGGFAIPYQDLKPVAAERLPDINVPTMVAYGRYDETSTNEAMRYAAHRIPGAKLKEFDTAHMINLENPSEFNEWLEAYLDLFLL